MKKFSKHTPEQIVRKLDKARELRESGSTTAQILTALGISEATLNRWQATYGAMTKSEAKELQRLREENTRLKRLLGQAELEKAAWKELSEGNFSAQLAVMMPSGISLGWATATGVPARSLDSFVVLIGALGSVRASRISTRT